MKMFNFIPYFSFLLLVVHLNVLASESTEQRKLKNKIHNFSSKNIDTDMSTKWSLTGLYLEKYDDNYTFIKNPQNFYYLFYYRSIIILMVHFKNIKTIFF